MAQFSHLFHFVTLFLSSCFGAVPAQQATCGVTKVTKIVGGTAASDFYPWFVALVRPESLNAENYVVACGAALITPKHVLTAAHCYNSDRPHKDDRLLIINLTDRCTKGGKILETAGLKIHRNYNRNARIPEYDIALIFLKEEVSNMPVCLPSRGRYAGKKGMIIGFGSTLLRSTYPCQMLYSEVDIIPKKKCVKGLSIPMSDGTICAGKLNGGIDACDGDSGGPLMAVNDQGAYELIGVVSYGDGCGRANSPGIYTDVTKRGYLEWVLERIANPKPTVSADNTVSEPSTPEKPTPDNSPSITDNVPAQPDQQRPPLRPSSFGMRPRPRPQPRPRPFIVRPLPYHPGMMMGPDESMMVGMGGSPTMMTDGDVFDAYHEAMVRHMRRLTQAALQAAANMQRPDPMFLM